MIPELSTETGQEPHEKTKSQLAEYKKETGQELQAYETVVAKNPFTGQEVTLHLDRAGHNAHALIVALADPNSSQELKDHALSMYLWERGRESTSMLLDLWRSKGSWTKETRVFQSQMRFDFEIFASRFCTYLEDQALRIQKWYSFVDVRLMKTDYEDWLKRRKEDEDKRREEEGDKFIPSQINFKSFWDTKVISPKTIELGMAVEQAIFQLDQADALRRGVDAIRQAREAQRGAGIYVDGKGKVYSMNDPALDDIIKADREATKEMEHDN